METVLTNENFAKEVLESGGMVLVDFYADWCGPCKMMSPVVDSIANEYPEYKVCKLNVDHAPDPAAQYGVMSIPTLIIFNNGKEIKKLIGYQPKDSVLKSLEESV